ncbi:hypothetical protein BJY59DRAFT_687446 [Rhodotorula toruloides]
MRGENEAERGERSQRTMRESGGGNERLGLGWAEGAREAGRRYGWLRCSMHSWKQTGCARRQGGCERGEVCGRLAETAQGGEMPRARGAKRATRRVECEGVCCVVETWSPTCFSLEEGSRLKKRDDDDEEKAKPRARRASLARTPCPVPLCPPGAQTQAHAYSHPE